MNSLCLPLLPLSASSLYLLSTGIQSEDFSKHLPADDFQIYCPSPQSSPKIPCPHHTPTFDHFLQLETLSLSDCVSRLSWFYSTLCSLMFKSLPLMLTTCLVRTSVPWFWDHLYDSDSSCPQSWCIRSFRLISTFSHDVSTYMSNRHLKSNMCKGDFVPKILYFLNEI